MIPTKIPVLLFTSPTQRGWSLLLMVKQFHCQVQLPPNLYVEWPLNRDVNLSTHIVKTHKKWGDSLTIALFYIASLDICLLYVMWCWNIEIHKSGEKKTFFQINIFFHWFCFIWQLIVNIYSILSIYNIVKTITGYFL